LKIFIFSCLRGQALYAFRQLHKYEAWKMVIVAVIHVVREVALYLSTPAVKRRLVK
jgi:hypothetical protein